MKGVLRNEPAQPSAASGVRRVHRTRLTTVTGGPWPRAHLNSHVNTYYQARPVITFAPNLVTRHWGRVPTVHGIQ